MKQTIKYNYPVNHTFEVYYHIGVLCILLKTRDLTESCHDKPIYNGVVEFSVDNESDKFLQVEAMIDNIPMKIERGQAPVIEIVCYNQSEEYMNNVRRHSTPLEPMIHETQNRAGSSSLGMFHRSSISDDAAASNHFQHYGIDSP